MSRKAKYEKLLKELHDDGSIGLDMSPGNPTCKAAELAILELLANPSNITVDREELFRLYMDEVSHICEVCDWVTSFGPKQIVDMISDIIEKNPDLTKKGI